MSQFSNHQSLFQNNVKSAPFNRGWSTFLTDLAAATSELRKEIEQLKEELKKRDEEEQQDDVLSVGRNIVGINKPLIIANTVGARRGQLVTYRRKTLKIATNTDEPANYAVGEASDSKLELWVAWSAGLIRIDASRGTDSGGRLWLSTSGSATDQESDIQNTTTGEFQNGALFKQFVGYTQGLSSQPVPPGFVRCSLNLLALHS